MWTGDVFFLTFTFDQFGFLRLKQACCRQHELLVSYSVRSLCLLSDEGMQTTRFPCEIDIVRVRSAAPHTGCAHSQGNTWTLPREQTLTNLTNEETTGFLLTIATRMFIIHLDFILPYLSSSKIQLELCLGLNSVCRLPCREVIFVIRCHPTPGNGRFLRFFEYSSVPFIRVFVLSPLGPCDWAASSWWPRGHFRDCVPGLLLLIMFPNYVAVSGEGVDVSFPFLSLGFVS